jgi:lysophospholipid acyltransferase (LPLAT)-like uncharacterized protein
MKLRNPWLIRSAGLLGAGVVQLWMGTLRFRFAFPAEHVYPADPRNQRFLYAIWHESMLSAVAIRLRAHTLISHHADGELIAQVCRHLGIGVVRGSPKEGATEGLLKLCRASERTHIVLTPDGPRGPRRRVKPGVAFLASLTGLPVVGVGFGHSRVWRFQSWDRFALPQPFSTAYAVFAPPVRVPPGLDRTDLGQYVRLIEERMLEATDTAERWADQASGRTACSHLPGMEGEGPEERGPLLPSPRWGEGLGVRGEEQQRASA